MRVTLKCAILGSPNCGKTTFLRRHIDGHFSNQPLPTNKIVFNTTEGQYEFRMCESDFPREAQQDAYIVMFDAADVQSFMFARTCISQIRQHFGMQVPIVFCRIQIDKRFKDIRGLVNAMQSFSLVTECTMFDVSAKSNYNFEKPFLAIMRMISNNPTLRLKEEVVIDAIFAI